MKTIHIIQSHHSEDLKRHLLKDSAALLNVEVLPFNIALKMDYDPQECVLISYNKIQTLKLKALKDSAINPINIEAYLELITELKLYGLTAESLPQTNALEIDNYLIIKTLFDLIPNPVLDDSIDYQAYAHYLSHAQTYYLKKHDIAINTLESVTPTTTHQKTLNIRHEFESVLQRIIEQNLTDVTFVIPSLAERLPMIETILNRYGFNVTLQNRQPLQLRKKFVSLLNLIQSPSQTTLTTALSHHAFGLRKNLDLIYLINLYNMDYNLPETLRSQNKDIQKIIDRSSQDYIQLRSYLTTLNYDCGFSDAIVQAYDLLRDIDFDDLTALRHFIEKNLHLYNDETSHLFIYHYEKTSSEPLTMEHFTFYDLNDFSIQPQEHVYALDMSSKNFPAVSANTGVLDDSYRAKITGYPNLEVRTTHTLHNKNTFLRSSHHLTLSYAYTNYEGKNQEPAYELFGSLASIPIAQVKQRTTPLQKNLSLGRGFVDALLMNDGSINTSISALETYQKDPLQFFVRYLLKYYELEYPSFGPLHLGNINHDAIEQHLSGVSHNTNLWHDFPDSTRLKMIRARNDLSMVQNYKFIDESIKVTEFKPAYFEHAFEASNLFKGFKIGGKIDRIDVLHDSFIIYDYKSSPTSLTSSKIQSGEQLQLLTYGFILEELLKKNMFGVYYYGLRSQNMLSDTYKFTRRLGITEQIYDIEAEWVKKRQYMGLIFQHLDGEFTKAIYHQRLTEDKKIAGHIKLSRTPFDKDTTFSVLQSVYARFYESLTNGIFDPYLVRKSLRPEYLTNLQKSLKEDES